MSDPSFSPSEQEGGATSATSATPIKGEIEVVFDDAIVRLFIIASVTWGIVAMSVGVTIATQLAWFQANFDISWLTFGRLRPLHTNAAIFAFVGNMIFAGVYYSLQRLLKTRMASDTLSKVHFWGWQLIIVAAAITLPLGITQSKEYAELEWPIDLAVTVIWVVFAINFFWTLVIRREKQIYVAIWFYISTIITIAVLWIVNNLALPVSMTKSYSLYAGVQDALVQWWYGHNAVAFFLTTPILGIMYYFLPKAANRPVYSYRLSVVHFWSLVFLYIWAGPHHLLYTALPEWAQSLGMVFSVMLWAPSWGGMLNGLFTLRGAWDKLRTDPVIKFLIAGITFYGMATFEGPLLSIKSVSALGHYTDWIIGHVHSGVLGWNGFMAAGVFYWLVPRLWGTKLHSKGLADAHFWIGTLGILLYAISMWIGGITQGLMWRAVTEDGALLYPNFVETLIAIRPMYIMRLTGGSLYLTGFCIMAWNLWKTARSGAPVDGKIRVQEKVDVSDDVSVMSLLGRKPLFLSLGAVVVGGVFFYSGKLVAGLMVIPMLIITVVTIRYFGKDLEQGKGHKTFHAILEGKPLLFSALALVGILIGGIAELIPTLIIDKAVPITGPVATPYSPLELHGRDVYVSEGCYTCHSQMIRPFVDEKLRYGDPSSAGEFIYDRPFQWGSKRTGPDLHRVGGKYPDSWHYKHLMNPRDTSPGSNMPNYFFLADMKIDFNDTVLKVKAMKTLNVPYTSDEVGNAATLAKKQAQKIASGLQKEGLKVEHDTKLVALISYLQRLGKHPPHPSSNTPSSTQTNHQKK